LVEIESTGATPHVGEIYFLVLRFVCTISSSCVVDQATDHNSQRMSTYDGSTDLVWRKYLSFLCLNYFRPLLGDDIPKNYPKKFPDAEIPAK